MRPIYIFDLDGTLADVSHRLHFISGEKKRWPEFFAACIDDKPIQRVVCTLRQLMKSGAEIWLWTGRSDEVELLTQRWLMQNRVLDFRTWRWLPHAPERFRMRRNGDHRPDHELKYEWLSEVEPPEYKRIVGVFEDRSRVVQMWRDAGITCFQVAPGDF